MSYKAIISLFSGILLISSIQLAVFLQPKSIKPTNISLPEMRQDLSILLSEIEQHSAFITLSPLKIISLIRKQIRLLESRYPLGVSSAKLAPELIKILALLNDPGTTVSTTSVKTGVLPFKLRPLSENWLALDADDYPVDNDFPFITHIDGLPMSAWVMASKKYQPLANSNRVALLHWLQQLDLLRQDIGLEVKPEVKLTLSNHQGQTSSKKLSVPKNLSFKQATLSTLIDIPEGTHILRLSDLSQFETEPKLRNRLKKAMTAPLLILDMRQSSGNSNRFLQLINRYQANAIYGEQLLGLSHYRISPKLRNDFLRPINFAPLSEYPQHTQRSFHDITDAIPLSQPSYFSPWFARTLTKTTSAEQRQVWSQMNAAHHLAIITGPECRQDCAWFANLASKWTNTILIGEPTSGDLTRKYHFNLPNSKLDIAISASLTYDNQGQRISGIPVIPDIQISLEQAIYWPGLLALLGYQNEARVAEFATTTNARL